MKPSFKNPLTWLLSILITILLFILSFFSFQLSWIAKPEEFITAMPTNVKHWTEKVLKITKKNNDHYIEDNFILINTSYDQEIIEKESGKTFPKKIVITDRGKLASLFKWLSDNPHLYKMAVCDVQFTDKGIDSIDRELESSIHTLLQSSSPNIIFAGESVESGFKPSIFNDINTSGLFGNTYYNNIENEGFVDYTLLKNEHIKSLPLLLYEKTHPAIANNSENAEEGFSKGFGGTIFRRNEHRKEFIWNDFTPEIYFDQEHLEEIENFKSYEMVQIPAQSTTMLRLGTSVLDSFSLEVMCELKAKNNNKPIILVGSFSGISDTHKTMFGQTSGSLILLNIFHQLDTGKTDVKLSYLLFLFTVLFLISVDVVFQGTIFTKKLFFIISLLLFGLPILLLLTLGTVSAYFKKMSAAAIHWVKEESHFIVLLIAGMIANTFFDRLINFILLAFTVFIIDKLFEFAIPESSGNKKKHGVHQENSQPA